MNSNPNTEDRDDVLFAFDNECQCPTAEQIIEWTRRYPQFADDIRDHAAVSLDTAAREGHPVEEPDENMLARGFSRVLNLLYDAKVAAESNELSATVQSCEPLQSFQQLMTARGKDVPKLARELDIQRGVLADLVSGRMLAPVGDRLCSAIITIRSCIRRGATGSKFRPCQSRQDARRPCAKLRRHHS